MEGCAAPAMWKRVVRELEYGLEDPAMTAHAPLPEQDRARRSETHRRGDRQHQRDQHGQRQKHTSAVEEALGRGARPGARALPDHGQRKARRSPGDAGTPTPGSPLPGAAQPGDRR